MCIHVSLDPLVVPQNPGNKRTLFVCIRHDSYATSITRRKHNLALSLKFTTKTCVEFPKFNRLYDLLWYMRQNTFSYNLPIRNTRLQRPNRFSHAIPRTQNQEYIKAGPQSIPVTIKANFTHTEKQKTNKDKNSADAQ